MAEEKKIKRPRGIALLLEGKCIACGARCQSSCPKDAIEMNDAGEPIIDVVTTLDPYVSHPYRFAAIWLTDSTESVLKGNQLLEKANVAVSPGVGFGPSGEGYVRFALVENTHRIRQAVRSIRRFLRNG